MAIGQSFAGNYGRLLGDFGVSVMEGRNEFHRRGRGPGIREARGLYRGHSFLGLPIRLWPVLMLFPTRTPDGGREVPVQWVDMAAPGRRSLLALQFLSAMRKVGMFRPGDTPPRVRQQNDVVHRRSRDGALFDACGG
jgi:hypothetical protein